MRSQSKSLLVVILTPRRVTTAEVHFLAGELNVTALGDIKPPEGVFDGDQFARGELLGRAIADFAAEKRVTAREAVMILPEATAITQLIKLPSMPREDMLGAVRAVAERYALFAEHVIAVDCVVAEELEEDGKQMSNVLLVAAREANVEQCQECARAAGFELLAVETVPVAAARSYRARFAPGETTAVAVVGAVKTDVMIFDEGVLRLCYSANAGLPETVKEGDQLAGGDDTADSFSPPPQLFSELSHCVRFYQNQFPSRAVQRVIVAADHPKAEVVTSHLAEQLQLPVTLGRPGSDFRLPVEVDDKAALAARALTFALLRGTALAAVGEGEALFPINLLPAASTLWRPVRPYLKLGIAALVVLLAGTLIWGRSLKNTIDGQEKRLSSVNMDIARLEPQLEALRAAKATEQALRNEVERETARIARERAVRWSQILVDVSERLPQDMWLTQLTSPDSSKISIMGIATNRETIPNAIEALASSPYLSSVALSSLSKDEVYAPGQAVIRYQINARLLRGLLPEPLPAAAPAAPAATEEAAQ